MPTTKILERIPLSAIVAGDNDRTVFDPSAVESLAAAISAVGLVQPITVRPRGNGTYEIVAGERRYRAVESLGWETVDAFVREMDNADAASVMLVENVHRVDLHPLDEAMAYRKRLSEGMSIDDLSSLTGVPVGRIRFRLELLNLCPVAQHLVKTEQMPARWGLHLSRVDHDRQMLALRAYRDRPFTFDQWKDMVDDLKSAQNEQALLELDNLMLEDEWAPTERRIAKPSKASVVSVLERLVSSMPDADTTEMHEARRILTLLDVAE